MIEINKNPTLRTLRQFSLAAGVFTALIGYLTLGRTGSLTISGLIWATGAVIMTLGIVRPHCVRVVYLCMTYLTAPIGIIISLVIVGTVYYVVVTPTGVVMRLLGRDPMRRKSDPAVSSYWLEREEPEPERYFRQF
jgi:hypothetical protein